VCSEVEPFGLGGGAQRAQGEGLARRECFAALAAPDGERDAQGEELRRTLGLVQG